MSLLSCKKREITSQPTVLAVLCTLLHREGSRTLAARCCKGPATSRRFAKPATRPLTCRLSKVQRGEAGNPLSSSCYHSRGTCRSGVSALQHRKLSPRPGQANRISTLESANSASHSASVPRSPLFRYTLARLFILKALCFLISSFRL